MENRHSGKRSTQSAPPFSTDLLGSKFLAALPALYFVTDFLPVLKFKTDNNSRHFLALQDNSFSGFVTLKHLERPLEEAQNAAKTRNIYLSLESNVIGIFYLPLDSLPILASVISSRV